MTRIHIQNSLQKVPAEAWDALVGDGSPFLEHSFLAGLEAFGCASPEAGWTPRPILVYDEEELVAAAPAWVKTHSMGEFVYDHSWADAANRAGFQYYPKLVVAVPFSPVTGNRLLVAPGQDVLVRRQPLLAGLDKASTDYHGVHLLFNPEEEAGFAKEHGHFSRLQFQFHWENKDYDSFDDWMAKAFKSKRRNKIRRERKSVAQAVSIEVVEAPGADLVDRLYDLYSVHCERFGPWGRAYLSRDFFQFMAEHWGHRLHAVVARKNGKIVAGAFNIRKGERLYGRYWGCSEDVDFLHFEICYYRPIAWAIDNGVRVFEPGHGGGHKYRRGFEPTLTYSSHRFRDPRLHGGLEDFALREAEQVRAQVIHLCRD
ncbi:MAG: GNAT family N-acetyltransferase [Rhodobacterales bacterium]|nr:GNAT family N-acetyltransferase [Rhodobacterales bacterium]